MSFKEEAMLKDKYSSIFLKVKWETLCVLSLKYFSQLAGFENTIGNITRIFLRFSWGSMTRIDQPRAQFNEVPFTLNYVYFSTVNFVVLISISCIS